MKFELTPEEQQQLKNKVESNPLHRWFAHREMMKFEVGDVLIKLVKRYNRLTSETTMEPENMASDTKMAQRYVYIYEDQYGIGYVKRLKVSDGTLGTELICLANLDLDDCQFQVDPEYAEHMLLDAEYNIKDIHKRSLEGKRLATKANRKVGVKPNTLKEFNDFFEKLKVGDKFWTSADYTGRWIQEYSITKMTQITIQKMDKDDQWPWRRWKENHPQGHDAAYLYEIHYQGQHGPRNNKTIELNTSVLYSQVPSKDEGKK